MGCRFKCDVVAELECCLAMAVLLGWLLGEAGDLETCMSLFWKGWQLIDEELEPLCWLLGEAVAVEELAELA